MCLVSVSQISINFILYAMPPKAYKEGVIHHPLNLGVTFKVRLFAGDTHFLNTLVNM